MPTVSSKYPYLLALLYGVIPFFISDLVSQPFSLGIFYLLGGMLFGLIWPGASWRWGLWITGPMIAFLFLSVVFAGQLEVFFKKDLPLLLLSIAVACVGSFVAAWFKRRRRAGR